MMDVIELYDEDEIERFLRNDLYLHIYSIADLDEFFRPYTTWYGITSSGVLRAVVLLYRGLTVPTVLALSTATDDMRILLSTIRGSLPERFSAHLSPGLEEVFATTHRATSHGEHRKMALLNPGAIRAYECSDVDRLAAEDLGALTSLYAESYPDNWFDPRMLKTEQYFGIREGGILVSVAGVHAYSRRYGVAALGNIATRTTHRNRGCARRVTARLCRSLLDEGIAIGLNVHTGNHAAINAYRSIGFKPIGNYYEFTFERS